MDTIRIYVILLFFCQVSSKVPETRFACDSEVYCYGPLLDAVQKSRLFEDSKHFVDMSMKEDPDLIIEAFKNLQKSSSHNVSQFELIHDFINKYFTPPGHELIEVDLNDWTNKPSLIKRVEDPDLKQWVSELNSLWKILARRMKEDVWLAENRHSLLYLPEAFIIPGDRFREVYYWDSYWIVNGLLLCDMTDTARGMILNLLHLVKTHGHVPNGARVYYINRSQPPLLIQMVRDYYNYTGDLQFIRDNIETMEKEYNFWINNRTVSVTDSSGVDHRMAHYRVQLHTPRPEGYMHDLDLTRDMTDDEKQKTYSNIASACESGWDFSTRWFADSANMKSIQTPDIIPVDLNVMLQINEHIMADFYGLLGNTEKEAKFRAAARTRFASINKLMWDEDTGVWFDYNMASNSVDKLNKNFFPSNIFPLLMERWNNEEKIKRAVQVMDYLTSTGALDFPGGMPTSLAKGSGQQWDMPNAWAPLIHLTVEALDTSGHPAAQDAAFNLSKAWINNNWLAWEETGQMFEKYNVENPGAAGSGGEYVVQKGFGWSNGAVLMLLDKYSDSMIILAKRHQGFSTSLIVCMVLIGILLVLVLMGIIGHARRKMAFQRKVPMGGGAFSISEHSNAVYHPVTEPLSRDNSQVRFK